jgi:hypothetical protein
MNFQQLGRRIHYTYHNLQGDGFVNGRYFGSTILLEAVCFVRAWLLWFSYRKEPDTENRVWCRYSTNGCGDLGIFGSPGTPVKLPSLLHMLLDLFIG